jgi:hypothetical protein
LRPLDGEAVLERERASESPAQDCEAAEPDRHGQSGERRVTGVGIRNVSYQYLAKAQGAECEHQPCVRIRSVSTSGLLPREAASIPPTGQHGERDEDLPNRRPDCRTRTSPTNSDRGVELEFMPAVAGACGDGNVPEGLLLRNLRLMKII